jgi:Spy/CpxP family protein refolding chaperone
MSFKSRVFSSITLAVAVGAFSTFAAAQTDNTAPSQQDGVQKQEKRERGFGKRGGFGKGMRGERGGKFGGMRGLRGIELTDAQKEQIRSIMETNRTANQASHEEFRTLMQARRSGGTLTDEQKQRMQTLRAQMRQNAEAMHAQIQAVLTPEQRTQIEQRRQEMQKKREQRRQMRQNRQAPDDSSNDM